MTGVTTLEVTDNLRGLVSRIESGEEVVLTKGGRPIARVTPSARSLSPSEAAALGAAFDVFRASQPQWRPGDEPVWKLRHEGHRY